MRLTLVVWFQLGELRLFSVTGISESGRGIPLLLGDGVLPFEMRNGCVTYQKLVSVEVRYALGSMASDY
jgi:hypothetical protein